MQWSVEAGLIEKWKSITWSRMKEEFDTMSDISFFERPEIDILTLEDTQSAFYLFILTTLLSIIVAIIECLVPKIVGSQPSGWRDVRQKSTPLRTNGWMLESQSM